jgi:hypothetical protein
MWPKGPEPQAGFLYNLLEAGVKQGTANAFQWYAFRLGLFYGPLDRKAS